MEFVLSQQSQGGGTGPYVSPMLKPNISPPVAPQQWSGQPPAFIMPGVADAAGAAKPAGEKKGPGTDPTKYKTAMCRNWEHSGTCGFRGCTFAHGRDELRPPRSTTQLPAGATAGAAGVSPVQGSISAQSTTTTTTKAQSVTATSPQSEVLSIPSLASSTSGNTTAAVTGSVGVMQMAQGGQGGGSRVDQLLQDLTAEIRRERESLAVHQEANRTLEMLLRREQADRAQRDKDKEEILELRERIRQLEATIVELRVLNGTSSTTAVAEAKTAAMPSLSSVTLPTSSAATTLTTQTVTINNVPSQNNLTTTQPSQQPSTTLGPESPTRTAEEQLKLQTLLNSLQM